MLDPEDRRLYSEIFSAPDDCVFDQAIGTTYSLDLESLLFALACIATRGSAEPESLLKDPVALLEAIHRVSNRVTLFHHAGETNAPTQPQAIFSLLEKCMVPARGRAGGAIFHPKLWVLRYTARSDGSPRFRVVILSRNLTTSRAWDSYLCLEGEPERGRQAESSDLAELIRALPSLAVPEVDEGRQDALRTLADEIHRIRFAAPAPFTSTAQFIATGFGKQPGFQPDDSGDAILAISPFVSNGMLQALRELGQHGMLIGRPEEMARCEAEVIQAWDAFTLSEGASSEADTAEDSLRVHSADPAPQGLHAKALAIQNKRRTAWWFGSGNLTDPVRTGTSVELMVRLEGPTSKVGIQAFLDAGFGKLREPYTFSPLPPDPQEGSRSAVTKAKLVLLDAKLRLRCQEEDGGWLLELSGIPQLNPSVKAGCHPVTLPGARAVPLVPSLLVFREVTLEGLSALMCFQLEAGSGGAHFACQLTLKLPIQGLPPERDAHVTRSIIKDRATFLRYLQCLLGNAGREFSSSSDSGKRNPQGGVAGGSLFASGLLEQLLETLHREPERLRGLKSLLARVPDDGEQGVVPADFRQLWSVVEPLLPPEARS